MIYIIGMSHIRSVVEGCSLSRWEVSRYRQEYGAAPRFLDWTTREEVVTEPVKIASIYIGDVGDYWGNILALEQAGGVLQYAPGFRALIESIDGGSDTTLFAFMHGEEHVYLSRDATPHPFDFHLPSHPNLAILPGRGVIPLELMTRKVKGLIARAIANYKLIRLARPNLRVVNVLCPPPTPAERWQRGPVGNPWMDDALRLKHYLLYVQTLTMALIPLGIPSLMPPAETVGPDGLLLPEHVYDPVHANEHYGRCVWRQINQLQSASRARAA